MGIENSSDNHICNYCNNSIPPLTYKLQQHTTSSLWVKHGQCCASCTAPPDTELVNKLEVLNDKEKVSHDETIAEEGNHRTNILLALLRAYDMEEQSGVKSLKRANRIIIAGRIVGAGGIAAALLLLFYEMFALSALLSFLGVAGILVCQFGMWKKSRIS